MNVELALRLMRQDDPLDEFDPADFSPNVPDYPDEFDPDNFDDDWSDTDDEPDDDSADELRRLLNNPRGGRPAAWCCSG